MLYVMLLGDDVGIVLYESCRGRSEGFYFLEGGGVGYVILGYRMGLFLVDISTTFYGY